MGALERLLTKSRRADQKMSIIFVEVDNRWKTEDLEYLLLVAKRLGAD